MDINNPDSTKYKSNKLNSTSTPINKSSDHKSAPIPKVSAQPKHTTVSSAGLKPGQVLKGEVVDIRYQEIKIQLDPEDQVITAKMDGSIELSINQSARFQVIEAQPDQLILKYLPEAAKPLQDTTIEKALSASGLPGTDRNQAIVQELLHHRMPIDKQTLQYLVRYSHKNRDATPATLVLMHKYHIPLTESNIQQFESYQKGEHPILQQLNTLTEDIFGLLKSRKAPGSPDPTAINQRLLSMFTMDTDQDLTQQTAKLASFLSKDEIDLFMKAVIISDNQISAADNHMNTLGLSHRMEQAYQDILSRQGKGNLTLMDLIRVLSERPNNNLTLSTTDPLSSEGSLPVQDINQNTSDKIAVSYRLESLNLPTLTFSSHTDGLKALLNHENFMNHPAYATLMDKIEFFGKDTLNLNSILNLQERESLSQTLGVTSGKLKDMILNDNLPVKDFLHIITENPEVFTKNVMQNLILLPEYQKILKEMLHHRWTLKPGQLSKQNMINNFYERLNDDIDVLRQMLQTEQHLSDNALSKSTTNIADKLSFMKDLNQVFTCFQMPVQLKDRDIHSELYVFTKKKALKDNDSLSVLLRLDMSNLGKTDIHITLSNTLIQANFYLENKETSTLIRSHLPEFISNIEKKGYRVKAEVKDAYDAFDFVDDFIEQNSQDNYISRYSFDIRT
ncbi:flagellar hook-length control protein FliK [Mobilitalea sibirica]|uniref:Flagellar hook-length control protein FliK n=1 Tax=Mobilitalea sibirica TaxID=1462919 RepID=A0A8J7H8U1_9FIRM|nr:flagellar hook-length control protein FliK [Mobilitalea sibirica]MBH1940535.1 flagellar hook-length control protein FliK [Mobilitalea sibirica]